MHGHTGSILCHGLCLEVNNETEGVENTSTKPLVHQYGEYNGIQEVPHLEEKILGWSECTCHGFIGQLGKSFNTSAGWKFIL